MPAKTYSYLAIGDSYTIGEGVPIYESFPYQTVQLLRKEGYPFYAPEIIAKTGWTTDELQNGIHHTSLQPAYDFVSLLIGVNNQYRGRKADEYAGEFELLLQQAISSAGNNEQHVFVLSIPDWSVTPFAKESNNKQVAVEINAYNAINKAISTQYQVNYINITDNSRQAAMDISLLTTDNLHPSGKEYAYWAKVLAGSIKKQME